MQLKAVASHIVLLLKESLYNLYYKLYLCDYNEKFCKRDPPPPRMGGFSHLELVYFPKLPLALWKRRLIDSLVDSLHVFVECTIHN